MNLNITPRIHPCLMIAIMSIVWMIVSFSISNISFAEPNSPASNPLIKPSLVEHLDAHFAVLHDKLKITRDQESKWREFTQVMLENIQTMQVLEEKRQQSAGAMTALEDLKSYSTIANEHANGIKRFIPAFEALYNSMSEEQRRNADSLFLSQRELMTQKKASIP